MPKKVPASLLLARAVLADRVPRAASLVNSLPMDDGRETMDEPAAHTLCQKMLIFQVLRADAPGQGLILRTAVGQSRGHVVAEFKDSRLNQLSVISYAHPDGLFM